MTAPLFIGAAAVDITTTLAGVDLKGGKLPLFDSSPSTMTVTAGGVARNAAEACNYMLKSDAGTKLLHVVGNDQYGQLLERHHDTVGLACHAIVVEPMQENQILTPVYNAMMASDGGMIMAGASMKLLDNLSPKLEAAARKLVYEKPSCLCVDTNMSAGILTEIVRQANEQYVPVFVEPTSVAKFKRLFNHPNMNAPSLWTPNEYEIHAAQGTCLWTDDTCTNVSYRIINKHGVLTCNSATLSGHMLQLRNMTVPTLLKLGSRGVVSAVKDDLHLLVTHFEPEVCENVVSVTGAGDSLVGAFCAQYHKYKTTHQDASIKQFVLDDDAFIPAMLKCRRAAELSLQTQAAVNPAIATVS